MKIGKQIIKGLREFNQSIREGKPVRQSTVRRMIVKGKPVYVHSRFTAPIGKLR